MLLFLLTASNLPAIEPWADKRLAVTNGLEIWLDASKEIASRVHNGSQNPAATKLINGGPLDIWHDASGNRRNFYQPTPEARPRLIQTPNGAIVRFDGVDDFLSSARPGKALEEATVFIMTAPKSNKKEFGAFLAFNVEENKPQPLMWTREQGKGRVFVSIPGHYSWTFDDPLFRLLICRGIAWSAHESLDRFNELVTIGARLSE